MKPITVIANSTAEALAEVQRRLGPNAVIVNIRKTAAPGLSRIWRDPQIEVQATLPAPAVPASSREHLSQLNQKVAHLKHRLASAKSPPSQSPANSERPPASKSQAKSKSPKNGFDLDPAAKDDFLKSLRAEAQALQHAHSSPREIQPEWDLTKLLENFGVLPLHAQWLADQVHARHEGRPFESLREHFCAVQDFLVQFWSRLADSARNSQAGIRVLVGAPGVGKTTAACKWLTREVLFENRPARVWRLDGRTANTADFLSIHGEILGLPVERVWDAEACARDPRIHYLDLPGVPADQPEAIRELSVHLKQLQRPEVLLALNVAYDLPHLLAHCRAFSSLPLTGLILTHLDEETRWSKFWNVLLSTKLPILYLSGGQEIPGQFTPASQESLFSALLEG